MRAFSFLAVALLLLSACDGASRAVTGPLVPADAPALDVAPEEWIVDTGPAFLQDLVGSSSFNRGSHVPWCGPQPRCSDNFQFRAGQFTLPHATALARIEVWMGRSFNFLPIAVGDLAIVVRANTILGGADVPGNPIHSKTYEMRHLRTGPGWEVFADYGAVLPAGKYWLAIEPLPDQEFVVPPLESFDEERPPRPLQAYAVANVNIPTWFNYTAAGSSQSQFGLRIAGTIVDLPVVFGAMTRVVREGESSDFDRIDGGVGTVWSRLYTLGSDGSQSARAQISENSLKAGTWSSSYRGISQSVAFRVFTNTTEETLTFRVNGVLRGRFEQARFGLPTGDLGVAAAVRVLDGEVFDELLAGSESGAGELLMSGDYMSEDDPSLVAIEATSSVLDPAVVTADEVHLPHGPFGVAIVEPVATGFISIEPQENFTVMFHVATHSRAGSFGDRRGVGAVNFANSLSPDEDFFTDFFGNPVEGIEALGSPEGLAPAAADLALGPVAATGEIGETHTVVATVTSEDGAPVPDEIVQFAVTAGPHAGLIGAAPTDDAGLASFSYSNSQGAGIDVIQATIGELTSNSVQMTWEGDVTPPFVSAVIDGTLGLEGWFTGDVSVRWSVTDDESPIHSPTCPVTLINTDTGGEKVVCAATSDGGTATEEIVIRRDATAPAVTVTGVADGATYLLGGVPLATCHTADATSGVASDALLLLEGGNADGSGLFVARCNEARDRAGNVGAASTTYTVAYPFNGFEAPISNQPIVNRIRAGQAVPVKFSLGGNRGLGILATGFPKSEIVPCDAGALVNGVEQTSTAGNTTLQYDVTTDEYTYVWKTERSWTGCRQLVLRLVDGTVHRATFEFR